MSRQNDLYEVLGLDKFAKDSEIKESYERLKALNAGNEEQLEEIGQAYAVLSDLQKRAEYDIRGKVSSKGRKRRPRQSDAIIKARNTLNTLFLAGAAVTAVLFILQFCGTDTKPFYWACGISIIIKVAEYILRLVP